MLWTYDFSLKRAAKAWPGPVIAAHLPPRNAFSTLRQAGWLDSFVKPCNASARRGFWIMPSGLHFIADSINLRLPAAGGASLSLSSTTMAKTTTKTV
jgi:hypothetical protein